MKATPMRAELSVEDFYGRMIARLSFPWFGPGGPGTHWPTLYECRVRTIKDRSIVLHGTETVGMAHDQRTLPQAWWCRVLPDSERPTHP